MGSCVQTVSRAGGRISSCHCSGAYTCSEVVCETTGSSGSGHRGFLMPFLCMTAGPEPGEGAGSIRATNVLGSRDWAISIF